MLSIRAGLFPVTTWMSIEARMGLVGRQGFEPQYRGPGEPFNGVLFAPVRML